MKSREKREVKGDSHTNAGIGENQKLQTFGRREKFVFSKIGKKSRKSQNKKSTHTKTTKEKMSKIKRKEPEQISKKSVRVIRPNHGEGLSAFRRHRITPEVPPPSQNENRSIKLIPPFSKVV